ncbi:MAG: hypothetical protein OXP69_16085 [Spirochaetaceae bacterium]|nr:hypothetical protein [Spirochaetaceae bacterium]
MKRAGVAMALAAAVLLACVACASDADQPAAAQAAAAPNGPAAAAPVAAAPAAPAADEMIAVTGRVVVTGSDPLVTLVIVTGANEQYELVGARADPLWDLQQRRVTVRGRIVRPASGPGFPAQLEVASYALARERG